MGNFVKKIRATVSVFTISAMALYAVPAVTTSAFSCYQDMSGSNDAGITWRYDGANEALYFDGTGELPVDYFSDVIDLVLNGFESNKIDCYVIGKDVQVPGQDVNNPNNPCSVYASATITDTFYTYHGSDMEKQHERFIQWCVDTWEHQTEEEIRAKYPLYFLEDGETYSREVAEDAKGIFSKKASWQYDGANRLLYVGGNGSFTSVEFWDAIATMDINVIVFGDEVTICDDDTISTDEASCSRTLYDLMKNTNWQDEYIGKLTIYVYAQSPMENSCKDVENYALSKFTDPIMSQYHFNVLSDEDVVQLANYAETGKEISANTVLIGDSNLDGKVDITDAVLISKVVSGAVTANETQQQVMDCNGDGAISADDNLALLQFLVHAVDSLPTA